MAVVNARVVGRRGAGVYVGRPSMWGNPFVVGRDGTRDEVVEAFERWVRTSADADAARIRRHVKALLGRDLVCWCAPARCHASVLEELAFEAALVDEEDRRAGVRE